MTVHFERAARIRFGHCDPAGIVYFPQYLVLFNGLVEDWFTDGLGISYADMLGPRRIGLPIVKLHCEFSAISRMGDDVQLKLRLERLGNASLSLALDCWAGDEQRVRSQQVLVFTDLHTHRAIAVPPDVRRALAACN
ncbi:acyl-CoA thioesterase [Ralstonia solanacearum]|uniref:acyl-CoA thioesterase n=1 Tax=Ralstonia solanacearum TaxID=305 RepID=UPI0005C57F61|nr:thioesterase family protein [Ralstonia solanacearum]MBB6592412.1 acyl-CoA thioesterase [Ralstonia solanacearum]MBB6596637.1 acyl-CoA thioesterase [Ralstonia solanacearum]MDB0542178.1 acyl-CoA thioesterase [Ralstonia solanacearum]MDB0551961.1 acyl-CoA thioesterase [Ralstonia solanacearum]MDB0557114.1 acyl-CoA thioesterase [Ralstonia solanacearum]